MLYLSQLDLPAARCKPLSLAVALAGLELVAVGAADHHPLPMQRLEQFQPRVALGVAATVVAVVVPVNFRRPAGVVEATGGLVALVQGEVVGRPVAVAAATTAAAVELAAVVGMGVLAAVNHRVGMSDQSDWLFKIRHSFYVRQQLVLGMETVVRGALGMGRAAEVIPSTVHTDMVVVAAT